MAQAADTLALPRVPAPASTLHRRRDILCAVLFTVAIAAMGLGAFRPRAQAALDAENRTITPWPSPWLTRAFTTDFERAFADRFGARIALLRLHNRTLVRAFGVSPAPNVMIGRDGWLYFKGEDGTAFDRFYRGTLAVADTDIRSVIAELKRRERFLASQRVSYVVTIAPDKFSIYPEHLPSWATRLVERTPLDRMVDAIAADGALRFVDLRGPLRAAKAPGPVYFATDSHWNLLGAAVAYGEVMREVQRAISPRMLPAIAPAALPPYVPGADVYRGDLAQLTGDPARFGEPDSAPLGKVLADPSSRCAKRTDSGADPAFETYACDRPGLPRTVVYRDSMAIPLIPLLSENFSHAVYVSSQRLDPALILRERPDVVIDEMVERAMFAPLAMPMPDPR